MSTEDKLDLVLKALATVAIGTYDELTASYCAKILEDVGESSIIEDLLKDRRKRN